MMLGTSPFEHFAATTPFSNPEDTWRLYDALADEAQAVREVRVNDPRVLVRQMMHADGTQLTWFVSQSPDPVTVTLESQQPLFDEDGQQITAVTLEAYGVLVVGTSRPRAGI